MILYNKCAPHLGGFNSYLDAEKATLNVRPNEDISELYSKTLASQMNIELSKATIYPNLIINRYLYLTMFCPYIIPFRAVKQV